MSPSITRVLLAAVALSVASCANDRRPALPTSPTTPAAVAAPARTSYLAASDSAIAAGGDLYVSANVDTAAGPEHIASYVARVRFDSRQLTFISDEAIPGVMRAVNAADSTMVIIAGASATGVPDTRLFVLHFRARMPVQNPALTLEITELNTVGFANRTLSIRHVKGMRVNRQLR